MDKPKPEGLDIKYYLALVSRKRWFVIIPFCLALIAGSVLAVKLPRRYEATALILVQPQRVPEKVVQAVVDRGLENRISNLSQQILSRSNLERVIVKFNLYSSENEKNMLSEDKVDSFRKRIKVDLSRTATRRDAESFSISYRDTDPKLTMQVTNGLAALFIDENLRMREGMAVGTSDFLAAELETTRRRLEEKEQALKDYRQRNMGELPEQLQANLNLLDRLNSQLGQSQASLYAAHVSLAALESEDRALLSVAPQSTAPRGEDSMSLPQLRERLATLRSNYTDQHPDVVRLRARIEKMEAEQPPVPSSLGAAGQAPAAPEKAMRPDSTRQRVILEGSIRGLESQIAKLNHAIKEAQKKVDTIPVREQELTTLTRDYENIKASYNSLLNRKFETEISVSMEKKQKGEQFEVIDPARLPEKPVFPDPKKLFLITIAAGLGIGGALVFLSNMMDSSVRKPSELEENFGIAVLAGIPRIFTARDRVRHRIRQAATAASIVVSLTLTAGFAFIVFNNPM